MVVESPLRHEAEQALLDRESGLQQVLDNSSAIVFAKDRRGRYIFVNREFERVTGRRADGVLGRTDDETFAPPLAARFRRNDLLVLNEQRCLQFEESADFGAGPRTFLSAKFPLHDASGEVYAVCGMSTDITERKRLEEAFSAAALAVSQSEEDTLFRELARYLSTILGIDGAFIATVSAERPHELQMLAFHMDGQVHENFTYPIHGTPCETVVGQCYRLYPERLTELFPRDEDFQRMRLESYAGHPLTTASGRPRGLIAAVSRKPFADAALVEATLKIFAVRVNAELERVEAAAALRASEANYREIFEASEDAILVHDWDTGAIVDANPRACEAYGYARSELIGLKPRDLGAGEQPLSEEEAMRGVDMARRVGHATFEWRRRRKDGSLHWDEVRLKRARIGGQWRVLAFTREITERKEAEEALRASEEQYRAVFNASADALVLWNSRYERVDVNPAYERMYGYTREEVLAGARNREMTEPHRQMQVELISRTLAGERCRRESETFGRDGRRFPIEVRTVPIQYRGEPHVLAVISDLTERVRVETERARLEARLRQAQKMEAIGQLTGGIAHDFNNLLTSIMGYVLLAGQREAAAGDARLGAYLAQAQRSCERARDLIQQMLMFSRGHRGSPRAVSLPAVVRGALATLQAGLPETLELVPALDAPVAPVHADPAQVEQVLLNLCLNSRDATGGNGRLRIHVGDAPATPHVCASCRQEVRGRFVELAVEDDGQGMTPEVLERIFEPFFSTKEAGKGSGMGLAMVHGIVHEHGGHVVVDSRPGEGTRFRVLWPAMSGNPQVIEPLEAGTPSRPPSPSLRGTVLVVDDEEAVGEFMRELLDTWGLEAVYASRPEVALDLVRAEPARFDVVITDHSMPRLTGLELAGRLRALRARLPVILYTGHGDGLAGDDVTRAGLSAVLRKPVDPVQLGQVLARCLAGPP